MQRILWGRRKERKKIEIGERRRERGKQGGTSGPFLEPTPSYISFKVSGHHFSVYKPSRASPCLGNGEQPCHTSGGGLGLPVTHYLPEFSHQLFKGGYYYPHFRENSKVLSDLCKVTQLSKQQR